MEQGVTEVEIRQGSTGQFDVEIDGTLRYSRAQTRGFPNEKEIVALTKPASG